MSRFEELAVEPGLRAGASFSPRQGGEGKRVRGEMQ